MEIAPNDIYIKGKYDEEILKKRIEAAKKGPKDEKLMETCKEFEAIFINMMLKEMRKTVPDGGLIEKSTGTKIFEDMYYEEVAKNISDKDDGIGLAKMLYEQFKMNYPKL